MDIKALCRQIDRCDPVLKYCDRFSEGSEKWNTERHSHPYIELIFYLAGTAGIEAGGQVIVPTIYDTVVYPANCSHMDGKMGERTREIICLWIDVPDLIIPHPFLLHDRSNTLKSLFALVYEEGSKEKADPYMLRYLLKALLTAVVRCAESPDEHDRITREIIPYIHEHLNRQIALAELAQVVHTSISYLSRKFRGSTGTTIIAYINHARIEAAKQMLVNTEYTVSEIAYQIGFESPKYFHRIFIRETGETPRSFRNSHKSS